MYFGEKYTNTYFRSSQSLLQKCLREKFALHIQIVEDNKDGSLIIEITQNRVLIFDKMTSYDITEFEQVLEEALELIK